MAVRMACTVKYRRLASLELSGTSARSSRYLPDLTGLGASRFLLLYRYSGMPLALVILLVLLGVV